MIRSLTTIEQDFNSHRMTFNLARADLAGLLTELAGRVESTVIESVVEKLINTSAEYGVDHAMRGFNENAAALNMRPLNAATLQMVGQVLGHLQATETAMDKLVVEKSAALKVQNPMSPDLYQLHGDEFILDLAAGRVIYPGTNETEPCTIELLSSADDDHDNDEDHERS